MARHQPETTYLPASHSHTLRLEVVNIVSLSQPLPPPNYHWHSSTKQCFSSISTQTQQKCKVLSGFSTGGVGVWWEGVRCCLWGLPRGWPLGWLWQSQQTQTQINQSILNSTQTVQFPCKLPQVVLKYNIFLVDSSQSTSHLKHINAINIDLSIDLKIRFGYLYSEIRKMNNTPDINQISPISKLHKENFQDIFCMNKDK